MSNWPGWKFWWLRAFTGLDHQVTRAETAPPQAAAASSAQPTLTVSQRPRVMLCIQANWLVPVSNSRATSGPPQNTPSRHGTTTVSVTSKDTTGVPRISVFARLPQVWLAVHEVRADWYCDAICRPVTSSRTANAASAAAARYAWLRCWRQTSQVIDLLQPWSGARTLARRPGPCSRVPVLRGRRRRPPRRDR